MSRFALAALVALPLLAQDARQIVAEAQKRQQVKSQRYEGILQVIDGTGKVADKRWISERSGSWGDSKALMRFTSPPEVKGVSLLVVNHPDRASDQWMWIPSIGRDRRIALQDRSTRFFGTDFSFEDLEERDVEQSDFKLLGDETADGVPCWKIEARPRKGKSSQYTQSIVWVRKDNYVTARVESFQKEQLVRRLEYKQIEQVQGIWTPRIFEVTDVKRKSKTVMKLEKLTFNLPLKDSDFTVQALRREQ